MRINVARHIFGKILKHMFPFKAGWTKGRLNCPNCQSRLGGFDFVSGADYPVHLIKSKIDYWKKSTNPTIGNS